MNSTAQGMPHPVWHEGERALQQHEGVADQLAFYGPRVILDYLIEPQRAFYPKLSSLFAGSVGPEGDAWATVFWGAPGFLQCPDPATLRMTVMPSLSDPALGGLNDGDAVGLLGIDLRTRRRSRLNGTIHQVNTEAFDITVRQSYGNCSQYVHARDLAFISDTGSIASDNAQALKQLDDRARSMIARAGTFFIASYVDRDRDERQVDVSHKGGMPGFVQIGEDGVLTVPDYAGNLYFNTLGNILLNPRCGLLFLDFTTGDLLQISGDGEVLLDVPRTAVYRGAERLLRVTPRKIIYRPAEMPLRAVG